MKPFGVQAFKLPPLILHPFSTPEDTTVLMDSSRASLAIQGFLPKSCSEEELDAQLLRGRYAELKMLFYIGKDLNRWSEQCTETASASASLFGRHLTAESFLSFLLHHSPAHVRTKLESWGVLDYPALFRRSIGLHTVFADLPSVKMLNIDFLRRYHRQLDFWYEYRLKDVAYERPGASDFVFDLYASGEYSMMLEQSWNADHLS